LVNYLQIRHGRVTIHFSSSETARVTGGVIRQESQF